MAADEVISCPACRHLLRVPTEYLGTQVQCPECQTQFHAAAGPAAGSLSNAVSRASSALPPSQRAGLSLMLPAVGLMLCGLIGGTTNGLQALQAFKNPDDTKKLIVQQLQQTRQMGLFNDDPPGDDVRQQLDEQRAEESLPIVRGTYLAFLGVSALVFAGGLSIMLGRAYGLALFGSAAAIINISGLCCVPGLVFGPWAIIVLLSPPGRAHFQKAF